METGNSRTDYGYLKVTTRIGISEKGRSKVLLVMHEEDRDAYEKLITDDVLQAGDCAVFTLKRGAESELEQNPADFAEHIQNIGEMRILVAVVTGRFLAEECFARLVQVEEAIEQNVAVLPVIVETGLVDRFNCDSVLSGMQFLDRTSTDPTELGYETKLRRYLDSMILTQTDVEEIRRHHTGHAFLSYRKKDRPLAKRLMEIIHDIKQDLAIWYDEFLTPGRHFDDEIKDTIQNSELFTMAMTPNMLEKPNYVEEHEYRTATDSQREILPVTMKDLGGADAGEVYPGLDSCIDAEDKAAIAEKLGMMAGRFTGYTGDTETAEHKFYIALGFLNGIDAETDGARAEKLLLEAAELHDGTYSKEAYRKLVSMYLNGAGVKLSRQDAKETQRKLFEFCADEYLRTFYDRDLADMINEQMIMGGLYYDDNEYDIAASIYESAAELISKAVLETEAGKKKYFCSRIYELGSLAFTRLSVIYVKSYQYEKSKSFIEAGIAVDRQLSETLNIGEDSVYRRLCDEGSLNEDRALSAQISGDFRTGIDLFLRNVEIEREILGLDLPELDPDEVRNISLGKIVGWYSRAANHAVMAGLYDEAKEYCEKSLEAFRELGGELKLMGSPDQQSDLFWTYFHLSEAGRLTGEFDLMSDAAEEAVRVLEKLIEQSSAEKWGEYLQKMRDRVIRKPQTEAGKKAKAWTERIPYTEHGAPDFSEFNPFGEAYVPFTSEDNYTSLKQELRAVEYLMTGSVFTSIARNDFNMIRKKYNEGRYDLGKDPYGSKRAEIDEWIRNLAEKLGLDDPQEDVPAAVYISEDDDDLPFGDDDIPYSADDDHDKLMEDIAHAEFMLESGFTGEAEEDLEYILHKLSEGGYNVGPETVRQQTEVIDRKLKEIGEM